MKSVAASRLAEAIQAAVKAAPPLPEEDAIPEGTDLDTLDRWLKRAEKNARDAEKDGNLPVLAQMGRLSASLLDAKRKATPPPVADPNDNPDMIALGAQVAARLHKLIDQAEDPTTEKP